jgi:sugar-phosphatase
MITADDVKRPKPDPEPFLLAARALKVDPTKCLVIENAPFGIEAARSAGRSVVAICTTLPAGDLSRAHWIVKNHDELEALLFGEYEQPEQQEPIPSAGGLQ